MLNKKEISLLSILPSTYVPTFAIADKRIMGDGKWLYELLSSFCFSLRSSKSINSTNNEYKLGHISKKSLIDISGRGFGRKRLNNAIKMLEHYKYLKITGHPKQWILYAIPYDGSFNIKNYFKDMIINVKDLGGNSHAK